MKVTELYVHPIKSCKPIRVKKMEIGEYGVVNDRKWMVITQENRYQGLKHNPKFALIECALDDTPGMPELKITLHSDDEEKETPFVVELFKENTEVVTEGQQASEWFTKFLVEEEKRDKLTLRLVRNFTKNIKRPAEAKVDGANNLIMFADAFPVMILSKASQDNLNTKLKNPISVTRFRPNIVVDGPESFPHMEDEWQELKVNEVALKVSEQCARCKVPTATEEGTFDKDNEPTATLKKAIKHNVFFGNYFANLNNGIISEGDNVEIIRSAPWTAFNDSPQIGF